jgi:hypothetical protein
MGANNELRIQHNLDVALVGFISMISRMDIELSRWVQYQGIEKNGSNILFKFKSSQNSLSFSVYGGVSIGDIEYKIEGNYDLVYNFFRTKKYEYLESVN